MHVYRTPNKFIIILSMFVSMKQVLKFGQALVSEWRWQWCLSLLSSVPERKNVFHQTDDFDNLHWIETKKSVHGILQDIFFCVLKLKLSNRWHRYTMYVCTVKKIQQKIILNVRVLITVIIKPLMSLLLPDLLLLHLFNPGHYCPYGALTFF